MMLVLNTVGAFHVERRESLLEVDNASDNILK